MRERRVRLLLLVFGIWALIGLNGLADVIRLRDGSVLRGRVVAYREKKFTIMVRIAGVDSEYIVPVDEVDSVEFGEEEGSPGGATRSGGAGAERLRPRGSEGQSATSREAGTRETGEGAAGSGKAARTAPAKDRELPGIGETGIVITEKKVTVAAAADWTSTEIRVQRGQRIVISATGEVDLGENQRSAPEGRRDLTDPRRPMPSQPTGGLVAVVGDDNEEYLFIGASTEFLAPHSGIIFLLVNEKSPQDNSGSFVARVRILSSR